MNFTKDTFLKLPKADVHNHFHLGGTQKLLFDRYPDSTISFPKKYNGLTGMIDFIYGHLNKIMTTKEDVINFMEMSIESSIQDNVTLLEASVDVGLSRFFNDSIEHVIASQLMIFRASVPGKRLTTRNSKYVLLFNSNDLLSLYC